MRSRWLIGGAAVLVLFVLWGVGSRFTASTAPSAPGLEPLITAKGLTPDQVRAAVQTYVPPGRYDDYLMAGREP